MKIKEIKKSGYEKYEVTFIPSWFEKLYGIKEHTKEYKQTIYSYVDKSGNKLSPYSWITQAIDKFRNSW